MNKIKLLVILTLVLLSSPAYASISLQMQIKTVKDDIQMIDGACFQAYSIPIKKVIK